MPDDDAFLNEDIELPEPTIRLDTAFIKQYSNNRILRQYIREKIKYLSFEGAAQMIYLLLIRNENDKIRLSEIQSHFNKIANSNKRMFNKNDDYSMHSALQKEIRDNLLLMIRKIHLPIDIKNLVKSDGEGYIVNSMISFDMIKETLCLENSDDIRFKYDFVNPDLDISLPKSGILQRCMIKIINNVSKFNFPKRFKYYCPRCKNITIVPSIETVSTNDIIDCNHTYEYMDANGKLQSKICNKSLSVDYHGSEFIDAWYYDVAYDVISEDGEQKTETSAGFSFIDLRPGYYEAIVFRLSDKKTTNLFYIVDVRPIRKNEFILPEQKQEENYLITLQKECDKYIKQQTGMDIYAMYPMKVALIMQKAFSEFGFRLISNVQLVGTASTGKSTLLKYYLCLLNDFKNLSTNGLSISIPSLRGTREKISIFNREISIITLGYFGSYTSIHIDEAGENQELVKNLKAFLLEDDYGYQKAGSSGILHKRKAHVNISENLNSEHLGQYRGSIKKSYKELLQVNVNNKELITWDDSWDLHQPLFRYIDNVFLYKVVKDKRKEFELKQVFWIDGYEFPLHERFPFYFFLVNEKHDKTFKKIVNENDSHKIISDNHQISTVLRNDDLSKFFASLKDYIESKDDVISFEKVDEILNHYGLECDSRQSSFFHNLLKISRIINKRMTANEQDYDLVKWLIEKMYCKLDIMDTNSYDIEGPPVSDTTSADEAADTIAKVEDKFVLNEEDFN